MPLALGVSLLLAACASQNTSTPAPDKTLDYVPGEQSPAAPSATAPPGDNDEYRIVTLLPRDAIQAIDDPQFLTAEEADQEYAPDEQVLGVVFDGEARAYSVSLLSRHEIVNDTVAGRLIAVTW